MLRSMGSGILPAASANLIEADWVVLDSAFAVNRGPLTGHTADDVFRPLFSKIVPTAAAPVGLG